jgi:CRP/FNR family transcriptional regulator, cyclic AMP receptor protein
MGKRHVEHLKQVPLFSGCTGRELETIAKASQELKVASGEMIVDQGQAGREAFVVMEGTATVRRNGRKVNTLGPGQIVGELSLLDRGPRTATVVADTDMVLLRIDQKDFLGVLDAVPSVAHKVLATLATRVRELDRAAFG